MSTFRHHPDGWIYIDDLQIPLDLFIEQEPAYRIPEPFTRREYVQGKGHFLYTKEDQVAGEFPWGQGDVYIAKKKLYISKRPTPPAPPEPPAPKVTQAEKMTALWNWAATGDKSEVLALLEKESDEAK
jgi:hypothetical protein